MDRGFCESADLSALSPRAAEVASAFVSLNNDIAVVIDADGVVTDAAQNPEAPVAATADRWVGRPWVESVAGETRRKIDLSLTDDGLTRIARRREVDMASPDGDTIPIAYTALRQGSHGPVLAMGRDLRAVGAIQQRFVETRHETERGYWRARQAESRGRLLFEVASDAVLTVDGQTLCIVEANRVATALLRAGYEPLAGRLVSRQFDAGSAAAVVELLNSVQASDGVAEIYARLNTTQAAVAVLATPVRSAAGVRLLLRVRCIEAAAMSAAIIPSGGIPGTFARPVECAEDGVIVTDSSGRVQLVNAAFLRLVHAAAEPDVCGRPLADWLGRIATDMPALIAEVRGNGLTRLVQSRLCRADGTGLDVDVVGRLLIEGDQECFGFTVRALDAGRALLPSSAAAELARAIEGLGALIGEVPLAGLLRQAEALARDFLLRQVPR